MNQFKSIPMRLSVVLLLGVILMSGCSDSSDSSSDGTQSPPVNIVVAVDEFGSAGDAGADGTESDAGSTQESTQGGSDSLTQNITQVNFEITVPAYVSDELQVRLVWGEKELAAKWDSDELWTASDDFPTNTENPLVVTFYDRNGAITLGSLERTFKTGSNASVTFQIMADDFDAGRWDSDNDGVSNLDELIGGSDPFADVPLEPVQSRLELVSDKTFRISWQLAAGAQFYRVLENSDGVSGFSPVSGNLNAPTQSFDHRVALYNRTNARYLVQACNASACVDSTEQAVSGTLWNAIGYVKASNTEASDAFGSAISLSADGTTLAVAAYGEDGASPGINGNQNDNSAPSSGAVYVFARIDDDWQQQAYLKASNVEKQDLFGFNLNISLSANGNTLVVGASGEQSAATGINGDGNSNAAGRSGAAYVFTRSKATWEQQAYIKAINTDEVDRFGDSVSLSGDGTTLAVGASTEDGGAIGVNGNQADNSAPDSGAVYLFEYSNGAWQQDAYLKASNAGAWKEFGDAVSLSADGNTLAVGSTRENSGATGIDGVQNDDSIPNSGAVYVFSRSNGSWQQQAYVKSSNPASGDRFGKVVSVSANGNTVAVGAYVENGAATGINGNQLNKAAAGAGAVYLFERSNENWAQQAYIKASNTDRDDRFGSAVSLSADGNSLAVGAPYEDSLATGINGNQNDNAADNTGAVYLFARSSQSWQQRAYIKASNTDTRDYFGTSVSLSADGDTLAIGAFAESGGATGVNGNQSDDTVSASGAVYLY